MSKEKFRFVVLSDDDEIYILTRNQIETLIKEADNGNEDIDFETIARIREVHFREDIRRNQIDWFKPDSVTDHLSARVILAVVHNLTSYHGKD